MYCIWQYFTVMQIQILIRFSGKKNKNKSPLKKILSLHGYLTQLKSTCPEILVKKIITLILDPCGNNYTEEIE